MKKYNINEFNKAYANICDEFAKRYLGEDYDPKRDNISDEYRLIGNRLQESVSLPGPLDIGDQTYDVNDIWVAINHNIPMDIVRERWDYTLECHYDSNLQRYNLYWYRKKSLNPKE